MNAKVIYTSTGGPSFINWKKKTEISRESIIMSNCVVNCLYLCMHQRVRTHKKYSQFYILNIAYVYVYTISVIYMYFIFELNYLRKLFLNRTVFMEPGFASFFKEHT